MFACRLVERRSQTSLLPKHATAISFPFVATDYETPGTGEEDIAHPAPGNPFHLAIPVHSMTAAKAFYGTLLGLPTGRDSPEKWQVCMYECACMRKCGYAL